MNKSSSLFITFITSILKILFAVLLVGVSFLSLSFFNGFDLATFILIGIYIISIFVFYKLIKNTSLKLSYKVLTIILIGILLRILWLINIKTLPYSDFETLYTAAINLTNGDNSIFQGVNYIARFPHLSYMIVYMSIIIKIFGESLLALKISNLIFSAITMYLIYKISLEVFNKEYLALSTLSISALFAPLITYVSVLATENIAIPFYLGAIYIFTLYTKKKVSSKWLLLCGLVLGIGNLFRMVAVITLIAFIVYIVLFVKETAINKVKYSVFLISTFFLVLFAGNLLLNSLGITEVPLWKGTEPKSTNVLKGTNIESFGRFTFEDAAIPEQYNYDYDAVDAAAKEIIKERLTQTPPLKLGIFYAGKFVGQWSQGDFSGVSWSETFTEDINFAINPKAKVVFQLFYVIIIALCLIGLFNKERIYKKNPLINLFYIILCGYGVSYLITEMQGRYAYIVCWIFIFLATCGIEIISKKITKLR